VGWNDKGTIINCYSTANVTGNSTIGGLVGKNTGGCNMEECRYGTISNCYSSGSVLGSSYVGGLVGENGSYATVSNCYATSSVSANSSVGGLVGSNGDTVSNSFWDIETSGQTTSAGGTPKTTAEMQDPNTFMEAGWDFVGQPDGPHDIWAEPDDGGYPILWWQLSPLPPLPTFSGGAGEPNNPYRLSTVADLNRIGHNPRLMAAHFKLINDIDLTGTECFLIGSNLFPFAGVFDGNGKKIYNFSNTPADTHYIGLLRYVDGPNAEIKDMRLINPDVDGDYNVGSLVGQLSDGTITNCYVWGGSVTGKGNVGGLTGINNGTITNCISSSSVTGRSSIGGLAGTNNGTITNCYSTGSVEGNWGVGGLVGYNHSDSTIISCYSTGSVTGGECVGGFVGCNSWDSTITNCYAIGSVAGMQEVAGLVGRNRSTITNCYSTGSVSGTTDFGGLIGYDNNGSYTKCFWDSDINPDVNGIGNVTDPNVIGESTTNMQAESTFTDAGWDFTTPVWKMNCEGMSYPKLSWWQPVLGDFLCPDGVDMRDFAVLAAQWGQPPAEPSADIAPNGGDNIVDRFDLAALVDNWLAGK